MGIQFDKESTIFHLQALETSYIIKIEGSGYLSHVYWGKKIRGYKGSNQVQFLDRAFSPNPDLSNRKLSLDTLPQEYPGYGNSDFRDPAYQIQLENGTTITDLRYLSHSIEKGKEGLDGLPSTYVEEDAEAETLKIECLDALTNCRVILSYTVYEKRNVITRSVKFINDGAQNLKLQRALSASVDFRDDEFDLVQLSGAWARERHIVRQPLRSGSQSIESRRGASSHQQNPFVALLRKDATEDHGEVFAFNFVYSGNFLAQVEVDQFHTSRVTMGINPFDFSWLLEPGQSFQTPEVVLVYSANGLGEMSRTFHQLYQSRLCRGKFRDQERPILINNWEATYFNFNAEKILAIADVAKDLGIELFVLDDGWFGKRDDDTTSLGDWFVDKRKLPNGLNELAGNIRDMNMQFGLWFEPEMISVDSELYREHPDWCLHVPERPRSEGRNQLILDFSREDVCTEIISRLSNILSSAPITYVKWDMNRHMTEIGSQLVPAARQRETAHRYMLGLYRVMEEITTKFPDILFESCSGGGGRFDPGILYYMPQTWTSDNTDAISRLKIQYGTSLVYPISSMGSHVSAVPNHQVHRTTSLDLRGHVAMSGNLGYELDVTKLPEEDKAKMKEQVTFYKEIRGLVQFGDFYRLVSPFDDGDASWMFVSNDKKEAFFVYCHVFAEANESLPIVKLKGLDPNLEYSIQGTDKSYFGDELMNAGISLPPDLRGDFKSIGWRLAANS